MSVQLLIIAVVAVMATLSCRREARHDASKAPAVTIDKGPSAAAPVTMEVFTTASLNGDITTVKMALATPAVANYADPEGRTALMLAAFNGHAETAALLLDAGAKIDTRDQTGRTALMYACSGDNDATVALLLKRGAGVNIADSEEHWTALMFAAAEGHGTEVRRLLDAGADPMAADIDGDDSVKFARDRGFNELADFIAHAKERAKAKRK